jgi:hypothetical protein
LRAGVRISILGVAASAVARSTKVVVWGAAGPPTVFGAVAAAFCLASALALRCAGAMTKIW